MANRFWVGGGSANTWAATANTNWASSSGGANNASVPGVSDVAIFDSNSGSSNSVIGASTAVQGLDCNGVVGTGAYAGTLTHNTSVTLTINTGATSSLRFSSGMTYTPASSTSLITFTHTSGTASVQSNGKQIASLTVNGAGGTTQLLDSILVNAVANSILTVTSGIFDAFNGAGGPYAITAGRFSLTGATTRSVILGSGVTVGGAQSNGNTLWDATTTTNLTFTPHSANITVLGPSSGTTNLQYLFVGGALTTYNGLIASATSIRSTLQINNANTFASLSVGAGWDLQLPNNTTTTVSSAFTITGTQTNPILIYSASSAQVSTLSVPSGACTLTWGGLQYITASGGATFTATNTFDFGANSGWSISPPADATVAAPTAAAIATAVWQDATSGDFTAANSIGKDLKTGAVPGAANGLFIAGTNAATTVTTALTTTFTGNLTGSVGSVTGAVGSVTGNVGGSVASVTGNVGGSVASVTGAVGSVSGNVGGNVTGSVGSVVAAVATTSNIKKNQALSGFTFTMTDSTNHAPVTGLTVTPHVSHDGGAFASTTNAVAELANGDYKIDLSASDLNGNNVMLRFNATGADDLNILIVTQP